MGGCEISHIKYSSVLGEAVAIAGTVISLMLCNKGRNFEKIYMECVETIKMSKMSAEEIPAKLK